MRNLIDVHLAEAVLIAELEEGDDDADDHREDAAIAKVLCRSLGTSSSSEVDSDRRDEDRPRLTASRFAATQRPVGKYPLGARQPSASHLCEPRAGRAGPVEDPRGAAGGLHRVVRQPSPKARFRVCAERVVLRHRRRPAGCHSFGRKAMAVQEGRALETLLRHCCGEVGRLWSNMSTFT
jgi:hypothetical protein